MFFNSFSRIPGVDEQLALHYAHLFIRDPLFLFCEDIHEDDETNWNLFEVQSILSHKT